MKKYMLLILTNMPITILFSALFFLLHITKTYTATPPLSTSPFTTISTAKKNSIAAALKNHLSENTLNLVIQYYASEWKKPRWKAQTIQLYDRILFNIALTPQKDCIAASLKYNIITFLSPETGIPIHHIDPCLIPFCSNYFDFSPDSELLAVSSVDSTIRIIDTHSNNNIYEIKNEKPIKVIKFLKRGKLIVSSPTSGIINVWNIDAKKCIQQIPFPHYGFFATAADEKLLATGAHRYTKLNIPFNSIKIWAANDNGTFDYTRTIKNMKWFLECMAFSPDGKQLAIGSLDRSSPRSPSYSKVYIKDPYTGKSIRKLKQYTGDISTIAYSLTGSLATGARDGTMLIWNPNNGQLLGQLKSHQTPVRSLFFSPKGDYLVSHSHEKTIRISKVPEAEDEKKNSCCIS